MSWSVYEWYLAIIYALILQRSLVRSVQSRSGLEWLGLVTVLTMTVATYMSGVWR